MKGIAFLVRLAQFLEHVAKIGTIFKLQKFLQKKMHFFLKKNDFCIFHIIYTRAVIYMRAVIPY